jgi:hypothetical protein
MPSATEAMASLHQARIQVTAISVNVCLATDLVTETMAELHAAKDYDSETMTGVLPVIGVGTFVLIHD